jgi:hypothetical protein
MRRVCQVACAALLAFDFSAAQSPSTAVSKFGKDIDISSASRDRSDATRTGQFGAQQSPPAGHPAAARFRGANTQVNDPALDTMQFLPGKFPRLYFNQSESTVAARKRGGEQTIVVAYNSEAEDRLQLLPNGSINYTQLLWSAYSTSTDGGATWTSGFVPLAPGATYTDGDPIVATDREGNFYYASGSDDGSNVFLQLNKSSDGLNWSDGIIITHDDAADKDWLAIGPDPANKHRDNLYLTWTSFQATGAELRFARSFDGGATWTSKTIFAPGSNPDSTLPQNFLTFSVPTVDPSSGRLYIPFVHFSNADKDFIQMLVSDDAGETFRFVNFNIPGSADPTLLSFIQPGTLSDCGVFGLGGSGFRLIVHSGSELGGGRFGLPRFRQSAWFSAQPAIVARDGSVTLVWPASTGSFLGDPLSGSQVFLIRSEDGGRNWSLPLQVSPNRPADVRQGNPAIAADDQGREILVSYYTQHSDGTLDVDLAQSQDGGRAFPVERIVRLTRTPMTLAPTNNPVPNRAPFQTRNYGDHVACYSLGEYNGLTWFDGDKLFATWTDLRNTVTEPTGPPPVLLPGLTHSQEDVFFQALKTSNGNLTPYIP